MSALIPLLAADSKASPLASLLPLLLLAPIVYMMIVPQRKQKQKHAAFVTSLAEGDAVVTSGGIHGVIVFVDVDTVDVEVDTDVVLRISKSSLARFEGERPERAGGDPADDTADVDANDEDTTPKKK